jgi:thioredoxin-related protein
MKKQLFFVLVLLLLFAGFLHITGCETETEEVLEEEKEVVEEEKEVVIVLATEPASFCPIIPPQSRAGADMIIHH